LNFASTERKEAVPADLTRAVTKVVKDVAGRGQYERSRGYQVKVAKSDRLREYNDTKMKRVISLTPYGV
jgi:hypothetical protein